MNPCESGQAAPAPFQSRRPTGDATARTGRAIASLAALALLVGGCDKIRKAMEYHPDAGTDSGAASPSSAPPATNPPSATIPAAPPARVRQWSPAELEARLLTAWVHAGGQDLQLVDGRARGRHGMTSIVDEDGRLRQPVYHDFDADGVLDVVVLVRIAVQDGQTLGAALFLNQDGYLHHAQTVPIDDGSFDTFFIEDGLLVLRYADPAAAGEGTSTRLRRFEMVGKTLSEIR